MFRCSTPPKFVRNTGSTARLRLRTQEDDDDESWFDDQDEFDDVPAAGNNKLFSTEKDFVFGGVTKGDSGFDHINKFLERTHSPSGKVRTARILFRRKECFFAVKFKL